MTIETETSRTIDVYYRVPVVASVNLDTQEVESVRVMDECIEDAHNYATEPGWRDQYQQAEAIAAEADWPAWEIG